MHTRTYMLDKRRKSGSLTVGDKKGVHKAVQHTDNHAQYHLAYISVQFSVVVSCTLCRRVVAASHAAVYPYLFRHAVHPHVLNTWLSHLQSSLTSLTTNRCIGSIQHMTNLLCTLVAAAAFFHVVTSTHLHGIQSLFSSFKPLVLSIDGITGLLHSFVYTAMASTMTCLLVRPYYTNRAQHRVPKTSW